MKQNKNPFRPRTRTAQPAEAQQPKPAEEMTDVELEESLRQARKELLDARHEELREREKARLAPEERTERRNLGEIFKKRGFK